ncbi:hypothetical protein [Flavitalea sp.]|nr:hypothetical protein [Flavitalea sp.]
MDFENYKLTNNPFRISPSNTAEELVWIGMDKLKEKLNQRIQSSIATSPSRIVINWGRYGSGKTHAANYYTKTNFIHDNFGKKTKNIKVNLPRSTKDPVQSFLRSLMGQLNFENIVEDFGLVKTEFKAEAPRIIEANTTDSIIGLFLKKFLGVDGVQNSLFPEIGFENSKDALRDYLYGDITKATLKKLNLPLGLEDDEQIVNLLSGIFNTITHQKKIYSAVFLWIDEFEDIESLPKITQDRFTTFLRQLIDKTPNNLTIFLNFTLKGFDAFEDLSIILGEALASRAKIHIDFDEPNEEESLIYIRNLLNHPNFRKPEFINDNDLYYPYQEASIKFIISNIGRKSLRKINETLSLILELALLENPIPPSITKEFVEKISSEIPSWKK